MQYALSTVVSILSSSNDDYLAAAGLGWYLISDGRDTTAQNSSDTTAQNQVQEHQMTTAARGTQAVVG